MFLESSESYREYIGDKYMRIQMSKTFFINHSTYNTTEKKSLMNIRIVKIHSNFFDD